MTSRRTILYVQPNSEIGGSDICLLRMIEALDTDRFRPVVVLPSDGPLVSAFERAGAAVHFVPMRQLRTLPSPVYQGAYIAKFWPSVFALRSIIQAERADLVHTNSLYSLYGAWAAKLCGKPHVWHVREIPPEIPIARPALGRFVEAMSAKVVFMTRACQQALFGSRNVPEATVLYEGINIAAFHDKADGLSVRSAIGVSEDAPLVAFVARLDPWKGLDVFIRSAALVRRRFPQAQFLVAGGSPPGFERYAADMQNLSRSLGLQSCMHFAGFRFSVQDIPALMAAITVLSHTSVQPEPFGLVLIEAMAMRRPVVATRAGGPIEILEDGVTGYLTQPGDAPANAEAVCRVLADKAAAARMGEAGRARVTDVFSVERFRTHLTAIYDDVVGSRTPIAAAAANSTR